FFQAEDGIRDFHVTGVQTCALPISGYERYEVSAYAKPGQQCRHNLNYWQFGDYLGIGPGAHGKLSFHDRIIRQAKLRNPTSWTKIGRASCRERVLVSVRAGAATTSR